MSGTSLDGLDLCFASFQKNENGIWKFEILHAETTKYSSRWEKKLRNANRLTTEEICALNSEYGFYLGDEVHQFIKKNKLKEVDLVASHGHTVFHQPSNKFTLQIGDGRAIRIRNNIPVVYDFRSQDVLMGGNGAPLVPIGDRLLFGEYDACINLGGFSNISMEQEERRIAFDICPVNIVLNHYARKFKKNYDEGGMMAKGGTVDEKVLEKLNALSFYSKKPPKSLGYEWVEKEVFPKLKRLKPENALATFTEHAAQKISETILNYHLKNVLVTGGGAYNDFMISKIKHKSDASLILPKKEIIDYKEALIFAFMGVLRLNNEVNVLSSSTGSSHDHCTGLVV